MNYHHIINYDRKRASGSTLFKYWKLHREVQEDSIGEFNHIAKVELKIDYIGYKLTILARILANISSLDGGNDQLGRMSGDFAQ